MAAHDAPEGFWTRVYETCFRFTYDPKGNKAVPSLVQVVNMSKSYKTKVAPLPQPSGDDDSGPRKPVTLEEPVAVVARGGVAEPPTEDEFVRATRETMMEATIDGLVNKALISALFLNFNIPSLMSPPMDVDEEDPTFIIFFLSAGFAIACGFYCILTGTFMATHAKAAMVTQTMALVFTEKMAPHIFWNHNVFLLQGLLTSVQVAAACVSYMDSHWALWLAIGACGVSLLGVALTKTAVNHTWAAALEAEDEREQSATPAAAKL